MKRFVPALLALAFALVAAPQAWADLAVPPPRPIIAASATTAVKLIVQVDESVKEPHLRIPRGLLPATAKTDKGAEARVFSLPTVVAGLALTLAFVSGGVWWVRRGRTAAAVVLALSLLGLGASVVWGDIPRPPRPPAPAPTLPLPAGVQLSDHIVLEIVDKGDAVTLIVNKSMVLKTDKPEEKNDKE